MKLWEDCVILYFLPMTIEKCSDQGWRFIDLMLLIIEIMVVETILVEIRVNQKLLLLNCHRIELFYEWSLPNSTVLTDVGGQGQRKSGQLCLVLARPDRQTADRFFSRNPDKIRTADRIETDRVRTDRHRKVIFLKIRTESWHRTKSIQTKSGQKDIGKYFFRKIRTESRQSESRIPDRESGPRESQNRFFRP